MGTCADTPEKMHVPVGRIGKESKETRSKYDTDRSIEWTSKLFTRR